MNSEKFNRMFRFALDTQHGIRPGMLTEKEGEAASPDIQDWANRIASEVDDQVAVDVYYDADSSTYVLRLVKGARVLVFRLSEAQVHTTGRELECQRTLQRKIKDLSNLI
jgi:hypothetical protein